MKKETIFKHEINESIQGNAALNCLKNRNNHKQMNETSKFDARFEFRKDLRELASPVAKKAYMIIRKRYGDSMWRQLGMDDCDEQGLIDMLNMYAEDGLNPQQIVNKMMGVRDEQEEDDAEDFISNVVNLMEDEGMIDDSQWDAAYYTVEEMVQSNPNLLQYPSYMQFLNVFGDDILSKLNYQEQEEDVDDAEDFISNVVNLMEDEGMIDNSQWDAAYYTVEEMVQSNPEVLQYPSYMQFLNVFGDDILSKLNNQEQEELPQMERHDMILALAQYLAESWIDTGDSGDLDDIYYAVAEVLDNTGDYPASTSWEDCKPWCQKHYREIEAKIY